MTQAEQGEVHLLGVGGVRTKQSSETSFPSIFPGQQQPADTSISLPPNLKYIESTDSIHVSWLASCNRLIPLTATKFQII